MTLVLEYVNIVVTVSCMCLNFVLRYKNHLYLIKPLHVRVDFTTDCFYGNKKERGCQQGKNGICSGYQHKPHDSNTTISSKPVQQVPSCEYIATFGLMHQVPHVSALIIHLQLVFGGTTILAWRAKSTSAPWTTALSTFINQNSPWPLNV